MLEHPPRVLVLFAHPAVHRSRVNRRLFAAVRAVPGVTAHDLYDAYPDYYIDVQREQELLIAHHVIVMQHPLYWYSTPAILREWQDLVLEHGWAYGHGGDALHGKVMLTAVSTGGPEASYQAGGFHRFTLRQLLAPIEQTAALCGMTYLAPFAVHATHLMTPETIAEHAADYARLLAMLCEDRVDIEAARHVPRLNADLAAIMRGKRKGD